MDMNLSITTKKKGATWKDPLLNYLEEHVFWIALELKGEMIHDMATLFSYIVDLKAEFLHCNKQYVKPPLFQATYLEESDQPITIVVGYSKEQLIITEKIITKQTQK